MLLTAGADVNASGSKGVTALHLAVMSENRALVVRLLKNCASVDPCDIQGEGTLYRAARLGLDEIATILMKAGADPNRREYVYRRTPLHIAAHLGHHKCVLALLYAKADVSAKDAEGYTALHTASENGHTEVIELLLSSGSDINALNGRDMSPLRLASCVGDAGANPNNQEVAGRNALWGVRNLEVLKLLFSRGVSANATDILGQTALHYGAYFGVDAAVLCALYKGGVDPTVRDRRGKTAADDARDAGHENAAKMMDLLVAKHQATQATSA